MKNDFIDSYLEFIDLHIFVSTLIEQIKVQKVKSSTSYFFILLVSNLKKSSKNLVLHISIEKKNKRLYYILI